MRAERTTQASAPSDGEPALSPVAALRHELATQHLAPGHAGTGPVPVATDVIGLHATRSATPYLSLHARIDSFEAADLDHELYESRTLLRLKCMRGTVFVVSRELAPLMFAATRAATVSGDRRWLGLARDVYDTWAPRVLDALAGTSLSGAELRTALRADDALPAVVSMLCDEARIVRDRPVGGRRSSAFRYRRWDDAFPDLDLTAVPPAEATQFLVARYVAVYGPVTERDVAWWTGLPVRHVRTALAALGDTVAAVRFPTDPQRYLVSTAALPRLTAPALPPDCGVVLLPELDPFVMGRSGRDRILDPALRSCVIDRGGNATSVVLADGRIVGVWDLVERPEPTVRVLLFDSADPRWEAALERCAAVGEFWFGERVPVVEYASMTPLTERTGVMRRPLDAAVRR